MVFLTSSKTAGGRFKLKENWEKEPQCCSTDERLHVYIILPPWDVLLSNNLNSWCYSVWYLVRSGMWGKRCSLRAETPGARESHVAYFTALPFLCSKSALGAKEFTSPPPKACVLPRHCTKVNGPWPLFLIKRHACWLTMVWLEAVLLSPLQKAALH